MLCMRCRRELPKDAVFCPYCGKKQMRTETPKALKRANGTGTVYKLSGRRKRPWVAAVGRKIIGYYLTKTEALLSLESINAKGGLPDKFNATLNDIYLDWCKTYYKEDTAQKTREEKETAWQRLSVLGSYKMRDLKASDYRAVIEGAMTQEAVRKDGTSRPSRPLGKSGKEKIRKLASQLCQHAMKDDIIDKNYALLVDMPEGETTQKDVFTTEQRDILWANANDRTVQIVLVLIYTGMRINELFSIERENVHLAEHYIIGGLKTEAGRNRFIPIASKIFPFVSAFYQEGNIRGGRYLILNSRGGKMDPKNFRDRNFYPTLEQLGIIEPAKRDKDGHLIPRTITPHSTRYTFFNMSRSAGANPDMLTLIMGHDNYEESIELYGKLTEDDKSTMKKIVDAI